MKLPKVFDQAEKDHPWADHCHGSYNGLYYVSAESDEKEEKFKIPTVEFGQTDLF